MRPSPAGGQVPQSQLAPLVDGAQQAVLHAAQLCQLAHALAAAPPKQAAQHLQQRASVRRALTIRPTTVRCVAKQGG